MQEGSTGPRLPRGQGCLGAGRAARTAMLVCALPIQCSTMSFVTHAVYECILPTFATPPIHLTFNIVLNHAQRCAANIVITSSQMSMCFNLQELGALKNQIKLAIDGGVDLIESQYYDGQVSIRNKMVHYSVVPASKVTFLDTFLFFTLRKEEQMTQFTMYDTTGLVHVLELFEILERLLVEAPEKLFDRAFAFVFMSCITRQWEAVTAHWNRMPDDVLATEVNHHFATLADDLRVRMTKFCNAFSLNKMDRFNSKVLLEAVRVLILTSDWKNVHERTLLCDIANPMK